MGRQKQFWLWLIGCGVGLIGLFVCMGVIVAAAATLYFIQQPVVDNRTPVPNPALVTIPDGPMTLTDAAAPVNRIVYINPNGQIVTVAPDGSASRQLTRETDLRFLFPAWSPNGRQVAAIASGRRDGGVFILNDQANSLLVELYRSPTNFPIYLYWSPTGQQISFLANHPQDGLGFHLVNSDGSSQDSLRATGSPFYWDWLGDGLKLFIHSGHTGEGSRLTFMDINGQSEAGNLAEPGFFQSPGLSASGRYLAYGTISSGQRQLIIADQVEGDQVFAQHQGQVALSWSPAAEQLAFTSPLNRSDLAFGPLRLMDAATGDVSLLDNGPVFAFFWSPNGQALAYLTLPSQRLEDELYAPEKGLLARPQFQHNELQLELRVVHITTGQRRVLLQFRPTPLFLNQFLPYFDQYALSHRLWSPESDALVLPMLNESRQPHIMVIRLDGTLPYPLAEGSMAFWSRQ
ncbi:MAG: hypothetical protein KJ063_10690 [Anaerolineae bacterium]|nr:hypothetical protein [Anaerolineae bacterium]